MIHHQALAAVGLCASDILKKRKRRTAITWLLYDPALAGPAVSRTHRHVSVLKRCSFKRLLQGIEACSSYIQVHGSAYYPTDVKKITLSNLKRQPVVRCPPLTLRAREVEFISNEASRSAVASISEISKTRERWIYPIGSAYALAYTAFVQMQRSASERGETRNMTIVYTTFVRVRSNPAVVVPVTSLPGVCFQSQLDLVALHRRFPLISIDSTPTPGSNSFWQSPDRRQPQEQEFIRAALLRPDQDGYLQDTIEKPEDVPLAIADHPDAIFRVLLLDRQLHLSADAVTIPGDCNPLELEWSGWLVPAGLEG
ncbi:hypothetical protein KCU78_g70, partial [Aureobasidium melanogenum]